MPLFSAIQADPVFRDAKAPYLVVDRNLVIRAVNPAYLKATGQERDDVLDRYMFAAFPDNPQLPEANGVRNLHLSLETVLRTHRPHHMPIQRYDVPARDDEGFLLKYWSPVNRPLLDERGRTAGVLHHVEDVTAVWSAALGLAEDPLHAFDPDRGAIALAHHLPRAITLAHPHPPADVAGTLEPGHGPTALRTRILIEQAKGVVMARRRCDPDEAFELLRNQARSSQAPLHEVCANVVAESTRLRPGH